MSIKEISHHWGELEYQGREAIVYFDTKKELFFVEYWEGDSKISSREMVSNHEDGGRVVHSARYAEDAAENYCLGYMPLDGYKKDE